MLGQGYSYVSDPVDMGLEPVWHGVNPPLDFAPHLAHPSLLPLSHITQPAPG